MLRWERYPKVNLSTAEVTCNSSPFLKHGGLSPLLLPGGFFLFPHARNFSGSPRALFLLVFWDTSLMNCWSVEWAQIESQECHKGRGRSFFSGSKLLYQLNYWKSLALSCACWCWIASYFEIIMLLPVFLFIMIKLSFVAFFLLHFEGGKDDSIFRDRALL